MSAHQVRHSPAATAPCRSRQCPRALSTRNITMIALPSRPGSPSPAIPSLRPIMPHVNCARLPSCRSGRSPSIVHPGAQAHNSGASCRAADITAWLVSRAECLSRRHWQANSQMRRTITRLHQTRTKIFLACTSSEHFRLRGPGFKRLSRSSGSQISLRAAIAKRTSGTASLSSGAVHRMRQQAPGCAAALQPLAGLAHLHRNGPARRHRAAVRSGGRPRCRWPPAMCPRPSPQLWLSTL